MLVHVGQFEGSVVRSSKELVTGHCDSTTARTGCKDRNDMAPDRHSPIVFRDPAKADCDDARPGCRIPTVA